ncbi:nitrilase-related carbon-nitrogen hydrolase [Moraxella oblonga]|uniref:nitrilase-related carbon-nitrogen hydrolase n=1 Tax=Moraxella oblonga TaxID=200413 RepID=UPI00082DA465
MPKIANIQLNSQDNIDKNLAIIERSVHTARAGGADLAVLPENACVMGSQKELAKRFDEMVAFYANLAKTTNIHLLAGTLPCPARPDGSPIDGKFRQSSLLFDNQGKLLARYDKIHLFRALVADGVGSYDEGCTFEAGDTPMVACCMIDGVAVGVGMTVCFDVRFPHLFQTIRKLGADIITVPSAFTHTTGKAHWQSLLTARALDSQCFIIGSAQGGTHHFTHKETPQTRQTWGHGIMVNANGQIVSSTNITDGGEFVITYADFDKNEQDQIRQAMPIFECQVSL